MSNELTGKIVFSSGKHGDYDIWTLDFSTAELRQLTRGDHWNDKARWWPDGRSIVYVSNINGTPDIYGCSADGSGQPVPLIQSDRWNDSPAPSPDGKHLGFVANIGENNELWIAEPDGSNPRQLTDHHASDTCFNWMPDARSILFSSDRDGNKDIYVLDIHTGRTRRLTFNEGMDIYPAASPDGQCIAFVSNRQVAPDTSSDEWTDRDLDIWMMRADGSMPVRITDNQGSDRCVTWSPDGTKLMYAATDRNSSAERLRIVDVTSVLSAYADKDESLARKKAASLRDTAVKLKRDALESDIGACRHSNFLTSWLPDSIARKLYDKNHFGSERFPDWHCGNSVGSQSATRVEGTAASS